MVEDVEELCPKLQAETFHEANVLKGREVHIFKSRPVESISATVAHQILAECHSRGGREHRVIETGLGYRVVHRAVRGLKSGWSIAQRETVVIEIVDATADRVAAGH